MSRDNIDFGRYLFRLRTSKGFSQKIVANKLGIDISMLSKIEHGERCVQNYMLEGIAELFELDLNQLQFDFLKNKIKFEYSRYPFFHDVVFDIAKKLKKKINNEKIFLS